MINRRTEEKVAYLDALLRLISKLKRHVKSNAYKLDNLKANHRVVIDCILVFFSTILSTTMRMGVGIFEYSLMALFLNSVVCSLVAGAVFLKLKIDESNWVKFSTSQIKLLLEGVIITNLLSYAMMVLMDREGCLSSSIMFINIFVLTVLLLIPRLLSKHRITTQASDIIVGNPSSMPSELENVICSNNFNPLGFIISDIDDSEIEYTDQFNSEKIPILGKLTEISAILHSLQSRKVMPKRLVIINPIASDELELLKTYTARNGIILLQVFSMAKTGAKVAD